MNDSYDVGYKKPPKHEQFQPGESGNPKGKPKGAKDFKTELEEELQEKITIKESGKQKKISKQRPVDYAIIIPHAKGGNCSATCQRSCRRLQ